MTTTKKLLVLLATVLGGCGADTSAIIIRGRAVISEPPECRVGSTGDFQLGTGVLDVAPGNPLTYWLPLYIRNALHIPELTPGQGQTQQKAWSSNAASVRVRPGGASATITHAPVTVEAGGGDVGDAFQVVDVGLGMRLQELAVAGQGRVVLEITLEGKTQDDEELDTNTFEYPLDLCVGCLAAPTCAPGQTLTATSCFAGQDTAPVCEGAAAATP
jgi:hypothetical protein